MKVAQILSLSSVLCAAIMISGVAGTCDDPGPLENGVVNDEGSTGETDAGDYELWTILQFSCNESYTISGSTVMSCYPSGWVPSLMPVCKEDCIEPDPIPHGRYEADFPVSGVSGTVKVMCDEGYSLAGANTIACSDGNYVNYQPGVTSKCKASCTRPTMSMSVKIVDGFPDDSEYIASGKVITYGCETGFSIVGPTQATCNNGEFDYIPQCVANCDMTAPPNARITGSNVHGGVAIVKCKAGFTPTDDYQVVCSYGQWSGQMPVCEELLSEYIAAYLPFENDFRDASGSGRDGAKAGPVAFAENMGVSGNAASFSGKGRVDVETDFFAYDNFSVSLWFKRTGNFDSYQGLISHGGYGDVSGSELIMGSENYGQVLNAGVATPWKKDTWDYVNIRATSNRWHHALYTYDGTEFNLYFDGEKQDGDSNCCPGILTPGDAPIRIGQAGPPLLKQYFYGLIDEVYIFTMALDETTALTMYERDKRDCDDPDLLVQYTFNDGFKDSSCYGWHGVPYGRVWAREGVAAFDQGQINIEEFRNFMWGSAVSISLWFQCFNCSEGRSYPAPEKFPRNRKGLITNGYYSPGSFELALDDTEGGTFIEGGFVERGSHFSPRELRAMVTGVQHVVLVHDNSGSQLYLEGNQVTNSSTSGELLTVNNPVTIGVTDSGDSKYAHYLQGAMKDLRIYNKALSEDDVDELHSAGPQG